MIRSASRVLIGKYEVYSREIFYYGEGKIWTVIFQFGKFYSFPTAVRLGTE